MESIATPFFSNSCVVTLKSGSIALPCRRRSPSPPRKRLLASRELRCQKMYVPGFAEASPEAKAARNLQDFFTYLAVKIVLAQLELGLVLHLSMKKADELNGYVKINDPVPGLRREQNASDVALVVALKCTLYSIQLTKSYNREAYDELMEFISGNSLNDGEKFCQRLMRESPRHKGLALRILEVRSAYAKQDFEWENLKKLAFKMVDESNTRLMRDYVEETSHLESEG
ncbi:hypothetical protein ZIOFF_013041 [Zingiber officinale]|uniref:Chaperonin-like RBCX protein 1, chloroplastic n=1 Tax=Zingiber officinale TaxID=94328 RepID=A0A8J5HTT3_ZINOF|nr:hypothetical protein ZIOFF_013041 [Zingiber officinale]